MAEKHPLGHANMKCSQIFPFLSWCSCKKNEKVQLNDGVKFLSKDFERSDGSRVKKKNTRMKVAKSKAKTGFLTLGYGFVAYF